MILLFVISFHHRLGLCPDLNWPGAALLTLGTVLLPFQLHAKSHGATPHNFGLDAARVSLKSLRPADGLEVTLFAAEPLVKNPTDMDIDERGRVWITQGVNYRSSFQPWGILDPAGDRIVNLAETGASFRTCTAASHFSSHSQTSRPTLPIPRFPAPDRVGTRSMAIGAGTSDPARTASAGAVQRSAWPSGVCAAR